VGLIKSKFNYKHASIVDTTDESSAEESLALDVNAGRNFPDAESYATETVFTPPPNVSWVMGDVTLVTTLLLDTDDANQIYTVV
jgi:hypothetical protein